MHEEKALSDILTNSADAALHTLVGKCLESSSANKKEDAQNEHNTACQNQYDSNHKLHTHKISEAKIAWLLRTLLLQDGRFENITVYGRDGKALASSGMCHFDKKFKEKHKDFNVTLLRTRSSSGVCTLTDEESGQSCKEHIYPICNYEGFYDIEEKNIVFIKYFSYMMRDS